MNRPLCLAWLVVCPFVVRAQIPEPVIPQGVGVNIHFVRGHQTDLDLIAAAGFKVVRMDFTWEAIETQPGHYDWSGYDELTANLQQRGLRPLYILDYSHRFYEDLVQSTNPITGQPQRDVASPRKPESVAAFARWAGAAAARYRGRGVIWEIWNEPNLTFWKPKPNVDDYLRLARATCEAIRAADPQATIIAPAISGFDPPFMERFLASGLLEHLAGVSVHPYRRQPPETVAADYATLRALIDRHAPGNRRIPILSGEWGYSTDSKGGVSLETQAAYLARQQLVNLLHQVPLSIWYDWKNDGPDPDEREHNFGTVTLDLQPKPAYHAAQTLTRELAGFRLARRLDVGNAADYVLVLTNRAGQIKLAAWTTSEPRSVTLPVRRQWRGRAEAVDGQGHPRPLSWENRRLTLALEAAPQYVTLHRVALP